MAFDKQAGQAYGKCTPAPAAKRVAVLVSGGGTNLGALIKAKTNGEMPNAKLVLVISSSPTAYALQRAAAAGIPAQVVNRGQYANAQSFDAEILRLLKAHRVQVVVLAGFMHIIGSTLLDAYKERIINIHPSLIPSFCGEGCYGLNVHRMALARGVKLTGATVHLVNEEVDGGRILMQTAVEVLPTDTPEALQKRVMEHAEWQMLPKALEMLCSEI